MIINSFEFSQACKNQVLSSQPAPLNATTFKPIDIGVVYVVITMGINHIKMLEPSIGSFAAKVG